MLSGIRLVLQSSFADGVSFDPFSLQQDGLADSGAWRQAMPRLFIVTENRLLPA
jgi:hypothetical protein